MPIILVRHGETLLNAARVMQPFDTGLSPRGLEQARLVAQRLAWHQPAAILTSDMPRAWQTAQAIADTTGLAPTICERLRERNFGDLRGHPHDSFGFDPLTMHAAPPNGESIPEFHSRTISAFALAVKIRSTLDGPLVVVSHGLVIDAILKLCTDVDIQILPERIGNTAITVLEPRHPHTPQLVNCAIHLTVKGLEEDASSLSGG